MHEITHAYPRAPMVRIASASETSPSRALLLDDAREETAGVARDLESLGIIVLESRVDSAESLRAALRGLAPDVVLSDHTRSELNPSCALETIRKVSPTTPFVIITGEQGASVGAAIRAGAEDVIRRTQLTVLEEVIREALAIRRPLRALTRRHLEVLRLVAEGNRTRSIAQRLGISPKTVESHRGEVMRRLDVHNVPGLVRYAVRVGLVPSGGLDP